jgi:hypothetical protein
MILLATAFAARAADGPPREDAPCDALAAWFSSRPVPPADLAPTEWWTASPPCPPAHDLIGAPPPRARDVSCVIGGRRSGPQTMFAEEGQVLLETRWDHGEEVGPRHEWDRATGRIVRVVPMAKGLRDGEVVEWQPEGEVVVTTYLRGAKNGPSFTLDASGALVKVESWKNDVRQGRACAWKDGVVESDQLYKAGAVAK